MRITVAGENSFILYFGDESNAEISTQVQLATLHIENTLGEFIIDLIPSYASLLVIYNADEIDHRQFRQKLRQQLKFISNPSTSTNKKPTEESSRVSGKLVEFPVYYSHESGPDLESIASKANLTIEDVIQIHQEQEYRVYAIGFAPGFAYLGEVDPRIAAPRLATPRLKVPKGAVAIADRQTAVYPAESPGGWNIIGLCPYPMFKLPQSNTPTKIAPNTLSTSQCMPVSVGDRVRFKSIDREQFLVLGGQLP